MPSTAHVTDGERRAIWNEWLNGDSLKSIQEYQAGELSLAVIKAVLSEGPPEAIKADDRFVHGARFFWISVSSEHLCPKSPDGGDIAFAVGRMPLRVSKRAFTKGVTAIRTAFRADHPTSDLALEIIEEVEADVALKFVTERGFPGWSMDEEGSITSLAPAEPDQAPAGSGLQP